MPAAVEFDHVSKLFLLQYNRPRSFQEFVVHALNRGRDDSREDFWVLKDVSFALDSGSTIGLIGANGAGKSTVLKLIARILEPNVGRVRISGRVGALLELGSGFHPDLTGRENIYLNGSILGVERSEIAGKLDEIIGFSELARFIDLPVRNYSSGMLVRLGFAVATSFWPEILLVDEVLAVGDQVFQARCLSRIRAIQQSGTTVVVVSHDLSVIQRMCQRVLWLEEGGVRADGKADHVINQYLEKVWANQKLLQGLSDDAEGQRWGSGEVRIEKVELLNEDGVSQPVFYTQGRFAVRMWYHADQAVHVPAFGIGLHDEQGNRVNGSNMVWSGTPIESVQGRGYVDYVVENLPLLPGRYSLTVAIYDHSVKHPYDHWDRMQGFVVLPGAAEMQDGVCYLPGRWTCRPTD